MVSSPAVAAASVVAGDVVDGRSVSIDELPGSLGPKGIKMLKIIFKNNKETR